MKNLLLLLVTLTALLNISCEQEKVDPSVKYDITKLKEHTSIQFKGQVLNQNIKWLSSNYNSDIQYGRGSFWCVTDDKSIQQRNFYISNKWEKDVITSLKISSPAFSIHDTFQNKKALFDIGKKIIRTSENTIYEGFTIEGNTKDDCFSTANGNQKWSSFEVIKIEELKNDTSIDPETRMIKVWAVVNCNLYACSGNKIGTIKDGQFIFEVEI
ncbi:hypothetical protein [Pontibacter arcticus]|uniref:Uncharacterized protein n=1 Tax=Pontibacter arcticus TaxID=2080288 RepID=A0A364RDR9_9BACT|nr:hypothetical protein [Pontibacter arcticus]RAU82461.1 hypothetical protein DP923_11800 [Pontibacter arcticus]